MMESSALKPSSSNTDCFFRGILTNGRHRRGYFNGFEIFLLRPIESHRPTQSELTLASAEQDLWASVSNFAGRANYPECPPAARKTLCIAARRISPWNIPGAASPANIAPKEFPDSLAVASTSAPTLVRKYINISTPTGSANCVHARAQLCVETR
jgi:hypothetical protein